jgi:hypothetical protein
MLGKSWLQNKLANDTGIINRVLPLTNQVGYGDNANSISISEEQIAARAREAVQQTPQEQLDLLGITEEELVKEVISIYKTGKHPETPAQQEAAKVLFSQLYNDIAKIMTDPAIVDKEAALLAAGLPRDPLNSVYFKAGQVALQTQQDMGITPAATTAADYMNATSPEAKKKLSEESKKKLETYLKQDEGGNYTNVNFQRTAEQTGQSPEQLAANWTQQSEVLKVVLSDTREYTDEMLMTFTRMGDGLRNQVLQADPEGITKAIARLPESARLEILKMQPEIQKLGETFGVDVAAGTINGLKVGFAKEAETGSPSKKAARAGEEGGKNVAAGTLQGIEKGLEDASKGKAEAIARRQAADIESKALQQELSNLPRNIQQDPSNAGNYTYLQSSKMENGVKINMYNDIIKMYHNNTIHRKITKSILKTSQTGHTERSMDETV